MSNSEVKVSKRVLIVDDALFMRNMLRDIFELAGWQVVADAESGEQALEEYRTLRPDLVTMDIVMPGMGGIETLKKLLAEEPSARVVVCSALGQKNLIMEALNAGARDFIVKPFKADQVLEVSERVVAE